MRLDPRLIGGPLHLAYRAWCASLRFREEGFQPTREFIESGGKTVFAFWHDELFPIPYYGLQLDLPCVAVVSRSQDGEFLSQVLHRLGVETARGSSHRGGLAALREAARLMDQGRHATITVDGPKGPRHQAKEGAVYLAHRAGARITPLRVRFSRRYIFHKAWDRFQLPWPGSRVDFRFGLPYAVEMDRLDASTLKRETSRLEENLAALA
ncbi:lysophospholipid acyltransferase family protein [Desulfohalovibrio reitneri]|uniref:lysophospholipid acyltransferase family protein n=1 Tax=Desulfohalovibrio reitneri TaxID=1307759 RepID=UPI0004A739FB|nr:lysophospholipid acyltransferase family protein [Desulfohalovibrio reitneri]